MLVPTTYYSTVSSQIVFTFGLQSPQFSILLMIAACKTINENYSENCPGMKLLYVCLCLCELINSVLVFVQRLFLMLWLCSH